MNGHWNKYGPTAARPQGRPGRELRPKSMTIDIHSHVAVPQAAWQRFVLHEGSAMEAFTAPELLTGRKLTPYDSFAIWMHFSRDRLAAGAKQAR